MKRESIRLSKETAVAHLWVFEGIAKLLILFGSLNGIRTRQICLRNQIVDRLQEGGEWVHEIRRIF
jgi:hypothetical protein